jgi:hypothetical protein
MTPLGAGPRFDFGPEAWLTGLSQLTWGAALAVAYWSPLAIRFQSSDEATRSPRPVP